MQSQRPPELGRLNVFVGRWEGSGTAKIAGQSDAQPVKGSWQAEWELNGWYLVSREEFDMGELGKTKGMGLWSWDPRRKKYRTWWFGGGGANISAATTYDENTKTWTLKFRGDGPSGSTMGRGSVKIVDDNTMEWSWAEWPRWDVLRLFKNTELTGTYKRK